MSQRGPVLTLKTRGEAPSCLRKRILDFFFTCGFWPFLNLENVLSPEGTLQSREPKEVQLFLLMFYCLRKRILDFQFTGGERPF